MVLSLVSRRSIPVSVLEHWRAEKNAGLKASIHVPELSQHSGSFTELFASSKDHKSRTRYRSGVAKFFSSGRCTAVAESKANMFRRLLRKTANCSSTSIEQLYKSSQCDTAASGREVFPITISTVAAHCFERKGNTSRCSCAWLSPDYILMVLRWTFMGGFMTIDFTTAGKLNELYRIISIVHLKRFGLLAPSISIVHTANLRSEACTTSGTVQPCSTHFQK
jgi:hypothetical protein